MINIPRELQWYIFDYLTYFEKLKFREVSKLSGFTIDIYVDFKKQDNGSMFEYFCTQILENIISYEFLLDHCNFIYTTYDFIRKKSRLYDKLENGIYYSSKSFIPRLWIQSLLLNNPLHDIYNQYLIIYKEDRGGSCIIRVCCYKNYFKRNIVRSSYILTEEMYNYLYSDVLLLRIY